MASIKRIIEGKRWMDEEEVGEGYGAEDSAPCYGDEKRCIFAIHELCIRMHVRK